MIVRKWRGVTKEADAEAYVRYLERTGFRELRATTGNFGVVALRQVSDGRAEFLVLTFWESKEAIRGFAGEDIERAVFYPEDERFLVEREDRVCHYEVVFRAGQTLGDGSW